MALTKQGYKRETYETILARVEVKAKELFGEDANTSNRSALGFVLRVIAWIVSLVWQDNENVYYSAYRRTAEGAQLDALLPYSGITRNPATFASGQVVFNGNPGVIIELGTIVSKKDETLYYTIEEGVIGSDGQTTVEVVAQASGVSGNADVGEINQILNPIEGLTSVTNEIAIVNGQEIESDVDARKRAELSIEGLGSATLAAIRTELLKIEGVRSIYIDENVGDATNEYGTPMHAIQAFVLGGAEQDIAQAILKKKAGGIQAFGETYAEVKDASGEIQRIGFTKAKTIQVYAKVTLTTNSSFASDGKEQVIDSLVDYVGGLDSNGNAHTGLNMGEEVVLSKLIASIYKVEGISDVEVLLSTDGEVYEASNIYIRKPEIAQMSANTIEVM